MIDRRCLTPLIDKQIFNSKHRFMTPDHAPRLQQSCFRRSDFSPVHWKAIIAGALVGLAVLFTLTLLILDASLFAESNLTNADRFPWQATWHGIVVIVSAGVGGYVGARMCGLNRMIDAGLHALLTWSAFVLLLTLVVPIGLPWSVDSGFRNYARGDGSKLGVLNEIGDSKFERELAVLLSNDVTYLASSSPHTRSLLKRRIENAKIQAAISELVASMAFDQTHAVMLVDRAAARAKRSREAEHFNAVIDENNAWWAFITASLSLTASLIGGVFAATAAGRRMRF
jgi:uncharacterized integral membrane protein